MSEVTCHLPECSVTFKAVNSNAKYCCGAHRAKHHRMLKEAAAGNLAALPKEEKTVKKKAATKAPDKTKKSTHLQAKELMDNIEKGATIPEESILPHKRNLPIEQIPVDADILDMQNTIEEDDELPIIRGNEDEVNVIEEEQETVTDVLPTVSKEKIKPSTARKTRTPKETEEVDPTLEVPGAKRGTKAKEESQIGKVLPSGGNYRSLSEYLAENPITSKDTLPGSKAEALRKLRS